MADRTRRYLSLLLGRPFDHEFPQDVPLALDGYNADLCLAFVCGGPPAAVAAAAAACDEAGVTLLDSPDPCELARTLAQLGYDLAPRARLLTCDRCGAVFATRQKLKRHRHRATLCSGAEAGGGIAAPAPPPSAQAGPRGPTQPTCRFCNRVFSRGDSLKRHAGSCPVLTRPDGMRKLRNQIAHEERAEMRLAEVEKKLADAAGQLEALRTLAAEARPVSALNPEHVAAAFEGATTAEALVRLVRRLHRDPARRNVYADPGRPDQVMVLVGKALPHGDWEARPLLDSVRDLFDDVVRDIRALPVRDVPSAVCRALEDYDRDPGACARQAGPAMGAHLVGNRPVDSILEYAVTT